MENIRYYIAVQDVLPLFIRTPSYLIIFKLFSKSKLRCSYALPGTCVSFVIVCCCSTQIFKLNSYTNSIWASPISRYGLFY